MTHLSPTAAELAKGGRYWSEQIRAAWQRFYRATAHAELQAIADEISRYREIMASCRTYRPVLVEAAS